MEPVCALKVQTLPTTIPNNLHSAASTLAGPTASRAAAVHAGVSVKGRKIFLERNSRTLPKLFFHIDALRKIEMNQWRVKSCKTKMNCAHSIQLF